MAYLDELFLPGPSPGKIYRVGLFEDKPLCFRDADGGLKGIYIDILEHVALKQGWKLNYVYEPSFQKNLQNLEEGKIDMMVSIGFSEERAKRFDFTKENVMTNWGEVFVHKDSTLRSIINLSGKRVAVMKGNIYYEGSHGLKNTADQFNLDIKFIEVASYEEVLLKIDRYEADAGLVSVLYGDMHKAEHQIQGTPVVFHPIELRFAFTKGKPHNAQLIKALDEELARMIEDEESVYYQSQARWLNRTTGTVHYYRLLLGLAVAGLLAALFFVISFILQAQVKKRTIELVEKNQEIEALNAGLELKVAERTLEVLQQKDEIEYQKLELEIINKQMRDSITYARNIQEAILPERSRICHYLPEHFVFSQPRDIVSGDFHWFAYDEHTGHSLLAVADCTGHGVPGAFMSMLGKSSLDYIMYEKHLTEPAQILQALQGDIYRALGTNAKDGMDIAICRFDFEAKKLLFAGAQSDLFLWRGGKITTIKGSKFPIGGSIKHYKIEREYQQHSIALREGDVVFMSSDGFPDQFGGPDNRKFTSRKMRELLEEISLLPMDAQKDILRKAHLDWRGTTRQIDDILVVGVKV
ncbi:MAG: transporter substrate-binding domain-containing protein [Microscillaceae bacterium]|nr:transporter substrate-binding domain-containing protein [Microscillaceae bacterium]